MHCYVEERCGLFWPHQIENELSKAPPFTIATKQSPSLNLSRCKRLSTLSALNQQSRILTLRSSNLEWTCAYSTTKLFNEASR